VNEPEPPSDYDNDGIPDTSDSCIYSPGPESNSGCPVNEPEPPADYDEDGVPDTSDDCPNEPGPIENGGCPDPSTLGYGTPDPDGDKISELYDYYSTNLVKYRMAVTLKQVTIR
jgi:hypothetical protein